MPCMKTKVKKRLLTKNVSSLFCLKQQFFKQSAGKILPITDLKTLNKLNGQIDPAGGMGHDQVRTRTGQLITQ